MSREPTPDALLAWKAGYNEATKLNTSLLIMGASMFVRRPMMTAFLLLMAGTFCWAGTIDSGLFTTYTSTSTTLSWVVCGSVGGGSGCYGAGQLGPFGQIGSIIESAKVIDIREGTVTRFLYVVDQAYGSGQNGVALYVYRRVDTIAGSYDHTEFTLKKTISLPLVGGSQAVVFLAANRGYLVIGTSNSTVPVEVNKHTYAITPLTIISQAPNSITADNYGFVVVTSPDGFFVVGPDGALREDGGGSPFTINNLLGTRP